MSISLFNIDSSIAVDDTYRHQAIKKGAHDMRETTPAKEVLSPAELQKMLPIGRTKVYSLLSAGSIPSYKVGRLRLIKKADVWRWLEENKYTPDGR
jgi:excisionase family DNA binding protein